ncbi:Structure-specific endonuclease subunit SLX4 [Apiospora kogelbergensis]|uniref:Structure-specific endonuclease subunit SLX4 n=1 Tax=Apiospora kogelbergensis TaxID=1337665 RepID=A0AAW0QL19_9PEZI
MASADVFESPYSEPPPSAQGIMMISSSPDLPSLAELAQRHAKRAAPLRSGSNAAPIPAAALTSFTSARNVLRQAPDDEDEDVRSPPPKTKSKNVRKRATKSQAKPTPETTTTPDQQEPITIPSSSPTGKPLKNTRSKKAESAQSTISSRVTKSTTTNKSKAKKKTVTVSRHFTSTKDEEKDATSKESTEPIGPDVPDLRGTATKAEVSAQPEVATPRRRDWTPPPEDDFENSELLSWSSKAPLPKEVFQSMCQDFARPGEKEPIAKPSAEIAEFMKKRKLNDLPVNEEATGSAETSPTKAAIPKKKKTVRTITELAMAPYLPEIPDVLLAPGNSETLLKHFDFDGAVKAQVDHQTVVMDKQEMKSKGKKKKAPAKPRKKKVGTAENPILLSPSSAMKQASNVDFLFGTSSQLQSDEPPEVLRDLQAAIQASNRTVDEDDEDDQSGLWHSGARDVDGSLLAFKIVDTADGADKGKRTSTPALEASPKENDFPDIDKICALPSQGGSSSLAETQNFQPRQAVPNLRTTLESNERPATVPPPQPSRPAPAAAKSKRPVMRPDLTILTDAQLSAKISTYGFKPMKRRSAMIALLEQCWDSSHAETTPNTTASAQPSAEKSPVKKPRGRPKKESTATASTAPEALKTTTAPESPKRVRGRTRKNSGSQSPVPSKVMSSVRRAAKLPSSKVAKVEIADSDEDEEVLSVAGRSPSPDPVFSSPPLLDLSISEDAADMSLNLSPTDQESSAFTYITKAVTTTPPTKDLQNPSWHELMLMFTPVVLEDLAAWLNAGELTRVGYDGEVSPAQLKQWCESKSVICLWRANVTGGSRKRR